MIHNFYLLTNFLNYHPVNLSSFFSLKILGYILLLLYLFICTYTDLKNHTINLILSMFFLAVGFIIILFSGNTELFQIISSIIPGLIFIIISLIFPHSLGFGDGIILCVCGIYSSVNFVIQLLFFALIISFIFSIFMLIKKHSLKYQFPFAPFILMSYIFCFYLHSGFI